MRAATCLALSWFALASLMSAHAAGPQFRFGEDNVPGWALMTSAERAAHHQRLLSFKHLDECQVYMAEHRKKMEERARERNRTLPTPRFDVCEQLKIQGLIE
jgi:hypothetical protein